MRVIYLNNIIKFIKSRKQNIERKRKREKKKQINNI